MLERDINIKSWENRSRCLDKDQETFKATRMLRAAWMWAEKSRSVAGKILRGILLPLYQSLMGVWSWYPQAARGSLAMFALSLLSSIQSPKKRQGCCCTGKKQWLHPWGAGADREALAVVCPFANRAVCSEDLSEIFQNRYFTALHILWWGTAEIPWCESLEGASVLSGWSGNKEWSWAAFWHGLSSLWL